MSRIAFICVSIFLFIFSFSQFAFAESDIEIPVTYDTMQVEIQVLENGNLEITETLAVIFNEERRGIFRYIPIVSYEGLKKNTTPIKLRSTLRNGEPEKRNLSNGLFETNIRLGHKNTYLTGAHTYEISYLIRDAINFKENYDELYWNISGNDWEDRWKNVETIITFPENINFQHLECFTGDLGSTEQNCEISSDGNIITSSANDYLTIIAQVDKGVLQEKGSFYHFSKFLLDYFLIIFAIINILYYGIHSYRSRDFEIGNIITEFDPPKDMNVEDIIYFYRKGSYGDVITTLIVSLAVKGYLKLEPVNPEKTKSRKRKATDTIKITRLRTDFEELPPAEKKVFIDILDFQNKEFILTSVLAIDEKVGEKVQKIRQEIFAQKEVNGISYYDPESYKNDISTRAFITTGVLGTFFVIFALTASFTAIGIFDSIIFVLACGLSLNFASGNRRRTPEAMNMIRKILGFKHFMHVAERYRSEWQERTSEYTKYLPYAVLFKDITHWSSIMKEISDIDLDRVTSSNIGFSSISAIGGMSSSISSAISSSSKSFSSSSSGGGGGGGGGGSW